MENQVIGKITEALKKAILSSCSNYLPFDIQWFAIWIFHQVHLSHLLHMSQTSMEQVFCTEKRKKIIRQSNINYDCPRVVTE